MRRVSADTVHDERTGLSWYEMELEMGRAAEPENDLPIGAWASSAYDSVAGWLLDELQGASESTPESGGDAANAESADLAAPLGHARELALSPGMPVEVHIRTGERTPLSYLVKPLTDYFSQSLREE